MSNIEIIPNPNQGKIKTKHGFIDFNDIPVIISESINSQIVKLIIFTLIIVSIILLYFYMFCYPEIKKQGLATSPYQVQILPPNKITGRYVVVSTNGGIVTSIKAFNKSIDISTHLGHTKKQNNTYYIDLNQDVLIDEIIVDGRPFPGIGQGTISILSDSGKLIWSNIIQNKQLQTFVIY